MVIHIKLLYRHTSVVGIVCWLYGSNNRQVHEERPSLERQCVSSQIAHWVEETTQRSSWVGQETEEGSWGAERFLGFLGRNAEARRACPELMGSEDFGDFWCWGCPWLSPAGPKQGHNALESGDGKGDGEGGVSGVVVVVLCPWDLGAPGRGRSSSLGQAGMRKHQNAEN